MPWILVVAHGTFIASGRILSFSARTLELWFVGWIVAVLGLSCSVVCSGLVPQPGIEPMCPAGFERSPAEVWVDSGSPQGPGNWQQQSWNVPPGVSPPGSCPASALLIFGAGYFIPVKNSPASCKMLSSILASTHYLSVAMSKLWQLKIPLELSSEGSTDHGWKPLSRLCELNMSVLCVM